MRTARIAHAGRSIVALAAALLVLGAATGTALAHAELDTSDPADGAVLEASPNTITLTFSQDLDPSKSSFKLSGPDGATIGTGEATADRVMTLDRLILAPGAYLIKWTSASADDGDIARGELTFTVAAAASPTVNPTANDVPSAEPASSAPAPSAVPTPAPTPAVTTAPTPAPSAAPTTPASSTSDVLLPIVVGLLIVAGVGAYVLRRNRTA